MLRGGRVRPKVAYDDRVIRGQRFKLWIASDRHAVKLFDLQNDPWEEHNLIDSSDPEIVAAKRRLMQVAEQFPLEDARTGIYTKSAAELGQEVRSVVITQRPMSVLGVVSPRKLCASLEHPLQDALKRVFKFDDFPIHWLRRTRSTDLKYIPINLPA